MKKHGIWPLFSHIRRNVCRLRNPCEDNLPDYFDDDEDDEEPQDQS